jgi:hypothetical protein
MHGRVTALVVALAFASIGCHRGRHAKSPAEMVANLRSPEWETRRHAADQLRDDGGPIPEALPALYDAMMHEHNLKAYGAMLITLGASGIAEARPLIDARMSDPSEDMRRWAKRALNLWLVRNGLMSENDDMPPLGDPLYGPPPPLPPTAPGSHPGLIPVVQGPAPVVEPEPFPPEPSAAPEGPGAGPGGSI